MLKWRPVAVFLWLFCFLGVCGLHRLYTRRYLTGVLWLLTFGLLGLGQLADWPNLGWMVDRANGSQELPRGHLGGAAPVAVTVYNTPAALEPAALARAPRSIRIRCGYCRTLNRESSSRCKGCSATL